MKELEQFFYSLGILKQMILTFLSACIAQIGTITAVLAIIVLLFQIRVLYYNGKLKRIQYDKECKEAKRDPKKD